jgi:hypothetical protein
VTGDEWPVKRNSQSSLAGYAKNRLRKPALLRIMNAKLRIMKQVHRMGPDPFRIPNFHLPDLQIPSSAEIKCR